MQKCKDSVYHMNHDKNEKISIIIEFWETFYKVTRNNQKHDKILRPEVRNYQDSWQRKNEEHLKNVELRQNGVWLSKFLELLKKTIKICGFRAKKRINLESWENSTTN